MPLLSQVEHSTILPNSVSIVHETSPEANWNRKTDGQADGKDHVSSQTDMLTKNLTKLVPQFLLYFSGYKHAKRLRQNSFER